MTVIELLEQAGVPYQHKENDNVYIECHKCGSKNLSINVCNGLWHCWSAACGEKGNFNDLAAVMQCEGAELSPVHSTRVGTSLTDEDRTAIEHAKTNKAEVIAWAASRLLSTETVLQFGIGYDANARAMVFPFYDGKGVLIGAKYRGDNGTQWIKGQEPLLYLLEPSDLKQDRIVIVEGETDALTLKQFGIPVVAVLGAGKDKGFELLRGSQRIYLGYDMDGSGEAGVEKAATALGRYRCKRVTWTAKDPNDMLKAGGTVEDIFRCLREATPLLSQTRSVNGFDALEEYHKLQDTLDKRLSSGFPRLDSFTKGMIPGVTYVLAEAGAGKSTFMYSLTTNNLLSGEAVAVASCEEHIISEAVPKITAQIIGRNPGGKKFEKEEVELAKDTLKRLNLYDGDETLDDVVEWIKECYYIHNVRLAVVDYLQLIVRDEKDTEKLKKDCYKLKRLTKDCPGLSIFCIVQPKQKQKLLTRDGMVKNDDLDGSDARGGAVINQSADAMLTVKPVNGYPNVTQFQYTKVRGGLRVAKKHWLGQFTQLEYDHDTLRQTELQQLIYGG